MLIDRALVLFVLCYNFHDYWVHYRLLWLIPVETFIMPLFAIKLESAQKLWNRGMIRAYNLVPLNDIKNGLSGANIYRLVLLFKNFNVASWMNEWILDLCWRTKDPETIWIKYLIPLSYLYNYKLNIPGFHDLSYEIC